MAATAAPMEAVEEPINSSIDLVADVKQTFDRIFQAAPSDSQGCDAFYDTSILCLMKLKVSCRELHAQLDDQRKTLEAKKSAIDKLQLGYENLLYRKAHLQREIRICKDLATPNLLEIEKELDRKLGSTEYQETLEAITQSTIEMLKEEMQERVEQKAKLDSIHEQHQALVEELDKKRKFLAEIPLKVAVIKSAALDLKNQFQSV